MASHPERRDSILRNMKEALQVLADKYDYILVQINLLGNILYLHRFNEHSAIEKVN